MMLFSLSSVKAYIYSINIKIMNKNTKLSKFAAFELDVKEQKNTKGGFKSKENLFDFSFLTPKHSIWGEVEVRRPIKGDLGSVSSIVPMTTNSFKKRIK